MDALGGYERSLSLGPWEGGGIFVLSLTLTSMLERLQLRLKAKELTVWWASNGRDVLNFLALVTVLLGLRGLGFVGPLLVCMSATFIVILSAFETYLGDRRFAGLVSLVASWMVGGLPLFLPVAVDGSLHHLFHFLF